jgi:hypothetical protein
MNNYLVSGFDVTFFPRKKVTKEIFPEIKMLPAHASLPTGVAF